MGYVNITFEKIVINSYQFWFSAENNRPLDPDIMTDANVKGSAFIPAKQNAKLILITDFSSMLAIISGIMMTLLI